MSNILERQRHAAYVHLSDKSHHYELSIPKTNMDYL